jgi:hypothetical protein
MTKKILITGSRDFLDSNIILNAISAEFDAEEQLIVIQGGARGADSIAQQLSRLSAFCTTVTVDADWVNLPRWEAGPRRNRHMLDLGPDVVLAFFQRGAKNRGTQNCVDQAKARGIPVKEFSS